LNILHIPKANEDNNEVNNDNLIINSNNNRNEELKNSKDKNDYKFGSMNNIMTRSEKESYIKNDRRKILFPEQPQ